MGFGARGETTLADACAQVQSSELERQRHQLDEAQEAAQPRRPRRRARTQTWPAPRGQAARDSEEAEPGDSPRRRKASGEAAVGEGAEAVGAEVCQPRERGAARGGGRRRAGGGGRSHVSMQARIVATGARHGSAPVPSSQPSCPFADCSNALLVAGKAGGAAAAAGARPRCQGGAGASRGAPPAGSGDEGARRIAAAAAIDSSATRGEDVLLKCILCMITFTRGYTNGAGSVHAVAAVTRLGVFREQA